MAKSKDARKTEKKEAAKTPKEKKAEKRMKKPTYEQSQNRIIKKAICS